MATTVQAASVISLDTHPARLSSRRRSEEFMAAMRRHPSYQGARQETRELHREDAVVLAFRRR